MPATIYVGWSASNGFFRDPDGPYVRRADFNKLQADCVAYKALIADLFHELEAHGSNTADLRAQLDLIGDTTCDT